MTASTTSGKYTPEQRRLLGQAYRMILSWGMRNKKAEGAAMDAGQASHSKTPVIPAQQRGAHE
jgi:hypothetical protein